MTTITLTNDQQNAMDAFLQFLTDPTETAFVLEGYSGTGKTTLIRTLLDQLPKLMKTAKLLCPSMRRYDVELTATTNKAAETLREVTGMNAGTIHSFLGLRVQTDYRTDTTKLIPANKGEKEGYLLFIDESSYIDRDLLSWIFKLTRNCKVVFIGDPAQLAPVKSSSTPVFDANFPKARLSQVVRQAEGNPIIDLSTRFRETVNSGQFFQFKPDGHHIQYMDRDEFNSAIEAEFCRPDWKYNQSKVLAWTNKRVVDYNHFIRDRALGNPHFQAGDYAVCNQYINIGRVAVKTDQLVCINSISPDMSYGVKGNKVVIDNRLETFLPDSLEDKKQKLKELRAKEYFNDVANIENSWIDLRAAYACTINKAQGSTYDRVFIDLDDIARCNSGNTLARMLYVAVSRAKHQIFLTGDLI